MRFRINEELESEELGMAELYRGLIKYCYDSIDRITSAIVTSRESGHEEHVEYFQDLIKKVDAIIEQLNKFIDELDVDLSTNHESIDESKKRKKRNSSAVRMLAGPGNVMQNIGFFNHLMGSDLSEVGTAESVFPSPEVPSSGATADIAGDTGCDAAGGEGVSVGGGE